MEIFKQFEFQAAHCLPLAEIDHKCRHLHGHSYRVVIHVSGELDANKGWLIDLARIKEAFAPILAELDHKYLNDVPGLENPTMELIAQWIWLRLSPVLPQLSRIDIHETATGGCSYTGDGHGR
jgi:6-pyruvoyltetrahydropterin/6-carboxytetrahydropterin synthase